MLLQLQLLLIVLGFEFEFLLLLLHLPLCVLLALQFTPQLLQSHLPLLLSFLGRLFHFFYTFLQPSNLPSFLLEGVFQSAQLCLFLLLLCTVRRKHAFDLDHHLFQLTITITDLVL